MPPVIATPSKHGPDLTTLSNFVFHPMAGLMIICLLGVAITGGMFVVPLYAFLTTTVPKTETARTVAANNIVNSGAMVIGSLMAFALSSVGVGPTGQLLLVAAMCLVSAWLGWKLHLACDSAGLELHHDRSGNRVGDVTIAKLLERV